MSVAAVEDDEDLYERDARCIPGDSPLVLLGACSCAAVITGMALLVSQTLGSQTTWPGPFASSICEYAMTSSSVVQPVNAMATVSFFLAGVIIIASAGHDASELIKLKLSAPAPVRLLARLPAWSLVWGSWLLAHGCTSFAYFASNAQYASGLVQFTWWGLTAHVVCYAWARVLLDRPEIHEVGCYGCVCVVHVTETWWFDRYATVGFFLLNSGVDAGLYYLAQQQVESTTTTTTVELVALVLLVLLTMPVAMHYVACWREYDEAWRRLGGAFALGVGALMLRLADSLNDVCEPQSKWQAYAAAQILGAGCVLMLYSFFRGGKPAPEYVVIVQKDGEEPLPPRDSLRELTTSVRRGGSGSRRVSMEIAVPQQAPPSPRESVYSQASSTTGAVRRPGQSRRSMEGAIMGLAEEQNATLRLLSQVGGSSSRSVERANSGGVALSPRSTAEEAARARRASIEAALLLHGQQSSAAPAPVGGSALSLTERLAMLS
jgi:hypothetical protein